MKLAHLAFACHVYSGMTNYDAAYRNFLKKVQFQLDLSIDQHRISLLKWLNGWGCRQFAIAYHEMASGAIRDWYQEFGNRFFPLDKTLLELSDDDFKMIGETYFALRNKIASKRGENQHEVKFGPTGAAKILFALRPKALIPWDESIRVERKRDDSAEGYAKYLQDDVRGELEEVSEDCERHGHRLLDLPDLLGRPTSSIAKMVDEYYWVTISRDCPIDNSTLQQWATWLRTSEG